MSALSALAVASLLAWLWLALLRGGFWRSAERLPEDVPEPVTWPEVVAVIPARDEAETIGRAVASLDRQDYPGRLSVIVVDDESRDGTAAIAGTAGKGVDVIAGAPLPPGWVGKVWAQAQGMAHAERTQPEGQWLLLTDADIEHAPSAVRRLVAFAETGGLDLVSLMVRLRCSGFWERLLIPAFVFFFQKLYPFPWVREPQRTTAAAAGGCMLVRRTALEATGGMAVIRGRLIDDCALAEQVKAGGRIWLGHARRTRSLRPYRGLGDVWSMVARTAYTQLRYSPLLLAGTVLGMVLLYAVPPAATLLGVFAGAVPAATAGGMAWALMAALAAPTARLYGQPALWGLLLPVAGVLYTLMTVDSARRHLQGAGGAWKGRRYDQYGKAGG